MPKVSTFSRLLFASAAMPLLAGAAAVAQEAAEEDNMRLAPVTVTALKKEQDLQDASATIDILGGDRLAEAGITSTQDIEFSVPGLQFGNAGFNGAKVGLRGVSSDRSFTGDDSSIAVNWNGVFMPYSGLALSRLYDVERVEVLKGPQGTLYGRNATGGAINIITKKAELGDTMTGFAEFSYGTNNTVRGNGAVNIPLAPNQAIRIAAATANGDGFIKNALNGERFGDENYITTRASYFGEFADWTVDLSGQYIKDDSLQLSALVPFSDNPVGTGITLKRDYFTTINDAVNNETTKNVFLSSNIEGEIGGIGFRSITGYTDYKVELASDAGFLFNPDEVPGFGGAAYGQFQASQEGSSFSQEINLFDTWGALDWQAGLFFLTQEVDETRFVDDRDAPFLGPFASISLDDFFLEQSGEAYGVFVDGTYSLTETLRIFGGVRWNSEDKTQRQIQTYEAPGSGLIEPGPVSTDQSLSATYEDPTYRAGVEFDLAENNLLYASYGRGFRSGAIGGLPGTEDYFDLAFFGPGGFGLQRLEPETVDAFEVGSKNVFLDGALTLNASYFFTKLSDQLIFSFDPTTFRVIEDNIGESEFQGVDLYASYDITDTLNVSFNGEYLDAEVTSLDASASQGFLAVGSTVPRAPELSYTFGTNYIVPISGRGDLSFNAEYAYKDDHFLNLGLTQAQEAVGLLSAGVRFEAASGGWYAFATGRNLTDEEYLVQGGPDVRFPNALTTGRPANPRQVFAGIGVRF